MNLLRQATNETVRQLGLNVPTVVMALVVIGFTTVIAATFSGPAAADPNTESVPGFLLWLIKSLAWTGAVAAVFVPLLAWNTHKVIRQQRAIREQLTMAIRSADWADDQIKSFLRNSLSDPLYGVAKCYAFGSIVGRYQIRDVDIVVQFDSSKQGPVRLYRERLRGIESTFQEYYSLKLHVQTFLFAEDEALDRFLIKAGSHERIL